MVRVLRDRNQQLAPYTHTTVCDTGVILDAIKTYVMPVVVSVVATWLAGDRIEITYTQALVASVEAAT